MLDCLPDNIILDVRNLKIVFNTEKDTTCAVNDVSFTLKKGETLGIVGESGSGKSVCSLALMRLLSQNGKIERGTILFQSSQFGVVDLVKCDEKTMMKIRGNDISMIFQEPMTSLNPVYTCGSQVSEAIILHQKLSKQEAKEKTIELFHKVLLPRPEQIYNSYPHQISGGQKQRVMIAMALSCNPDLLIADEPTTALDVTVQAKILDILKELRDSMGLSIIFISHDLGVIGEIADQVMVMYQGNVMEHGPVLEIFNNPQNPYTKGLLACRPRLDLKMRKLPVVSDFMSTDEEGNIKERKKSDEDKAFASLGEAILMNYISDEEIQEKNKKLKSNPPHLVVKNLKTYFPVKKGFLGKTIDYVKAVDDVSFEVYPGETVGLVGESGCGKTTLGRTILRLVEPTDGEIIFEGKSINKLKGDDLRLLRKNMQIIFQDPYSSLNPRMTIGEAIVEPMRVYGLYDSEFARKRHAIELLETVNLHRKHFQRYPFEFSGGQRQRICIARALALSPKFIICDESVSALDVSVQAQVLNLLNKLKEEFGFTYIFISHDLSVVKFMSDRIIVMNKGKIEEIGYSEEIYKSPQKEYTKKLIDSIPKGDIEQIRKIQFKRMDRLRTLMND